MTKEPQKPCRTSISRLLNTAEAAEMLGIEPSTLRDWKCQRIGPPYIQTSARCVRYYEEDIHQFNADRRVVPTVRCVGRFAH